MEKKNFQHHVGLWIQIKTILKTASTNKLSMYLNKTEKK